MSGSGKAGGQGITSEAMIEALRARGAERFDPVRFRYIEALSGRAAAQPDKVKSMLEGRLAILLIDYTKRFEQARARAGEILGRQAEQFPEAADALGQRFQAGDFTGLHRLVASLEAQGSSGPLAELLAEIGQHAPEAPAGRSEKGSGALVGPRGELKSLTYFRRTWSQLSVDQQLTKALAQAPENAGPLNSHRLALQSLKLMRDISPDYLKRFLSYVDALLWLDQAESSRNPGQKNVGDGDKKRKSGRRNTG